MALSIYIEAPAFIQTLSRQTDMTIKYYLFRAKWLWKNRNWQNTRQKFKAMEKEWLSYGNL